jgi:hypothetical protein
MSVDKSFDRILEPHKYSSLDILDLFMEVDKQHIHQRAKCSNDFEPFGLSLERPPDLAFKEIAHQGSSINKVRIKNTLHMMRLFYHDMAQKHVDIILEHPDVKPSRIARNGWVQLRKTWIDIARSEAALILSTLPFYISSDDAPITPATVFPLLWPLCTVMVSPQVTPEQHTRAREALLQIGSRAKVPVATKLANAQFYASEDLAKETYILHSAFHN